MIQTINKKGIHILPLENLSSYIPLKAHQTRQMTGFLAILTPETYNLPTQIATPR